MKTGSVTMETVSGLVAIGYETALESATMRNEITS